MTIPKDVTFLSFVTVLMTLGVLFHGSSQTKPSPPNAVNVAFPQQVFPNFADAETPAGTIDGTNATFTLIQPPNPRLSLQLYRNGQLMRAGTGNDYILDGLTVTFLAGAIPQAGDVLTASYRF